MRKLLTIAFSAIFLLSACATQSPLKTGSGKPEGLMEGVTKKQVTDFLVNGMVNGGWDVSKTDEYSISFAKNANDIATQLLLGSKFNTTPEWRVRYNLIPLQTGIKTIATIQVVTNPGSGFENSQDFSGSGPMAIDIQKFLERGASSSRMSAGIMQVNAAIAKRGRVGFSLNIQHEVINIYASSPSEKAGVKIGDIFKSVDGKMMPPTSTQTELSEALLATTGEAETTGVYVFERKGKEIEIKIKRELLKD